MLQTVNEISIANKGMKGKGILDSCLCKIYLVCMQEVFQGVKLDL